MFSSPDQIAAIIILIPSLRSLRLCEIPFPQSAASLAKTLRSPREFPRSRSHHHPRPSAVSPLTTIHGSVRASYCSSPFRIEKRLDPLGHTRLPGLNSTPIASNSLRASRRPLRTERKSLAALKRRKPISICSEIRASEEAIPATLPWSWHARTTLRMISCTSDDPAVPRFPD